MFKPKSDSNNSIVNTSLVEIKDIDVDLIYDKGKDRISPDDDFNNLVTSIEKVGLVTRILVTPDDVTGKYCIISGRRRLKAFKHLGKKTIPCIVDGNLKPTEFSIQQLIENEHKPLSVIDKAIAIEKRMTSYKLSLNQMAEMVDMDRSYISRIKNLLNTKEPIKKLARTGKIKSVGNLLFLNEHIKDDDKLSSIVEDIIQGKTKFTNVIKELRQKVKNQNQNEQKSISIRFAPVSLIHIAKTLNRSEKITIDTVNEALEFLKNFNLKQIKKNANKKVNDEK